MRTLAKILLIITLVWAVAFSTLAVGAWYVVHKTGLISIHVSERDWDGSRHNVRLYVPAVFANIAIRMAPMIHRIAEHENGHYMHANLEWDDEWHGHVRREWRHDGDFCFDDEELREWLPAIRAAADELERYPNATFVDVVDGDERVKVMARDGALVIEAHSDDEDVEVHVPARTVSIALRTLQDL